LYAISIPPFTSGSPMSWCLGATSPNWSMSHYLHSRSACSKVRPLRPIYANACNILIAQ
jgi:hypothetical protein